MRLALLVLCVFGLSGCMLPRPYVAADYTRQCAQANAAPDGTVLTVMVRLPDCRKHGQMRMTFLRSPEVQFAAATAPGPRTLLNEQDFDAALTARIQQRGAPILFIHGFNNDSATALKRAHAIEMATGHPVIAVLWPSYGQIIKYPWDEANAEWASAELREWFEKLIQSRPGMSIVAHSMGNRIAIDLLRSFRRDLPGTPLHVAHLVMAAPDIDRDAFRLSLIDHDELGIDTTIYASTHDQALSASWRAHGNGRAGDLSSWVTGHQAVHVLPAAQGVSIVDTSLLKGDPIGHATFITSPQGAADLCRVINDQTFAGRTPLGQGYWLIDPTKPGQDSCTDHGELAARSLRK